VGGASGTEVLEVGTQGYKSFSHKLRFWVWGKVYLAPKIKGVY